jgi:hypothetical protein
VNRFVSCPHHVRSAELGTLTVLVDTRTGRVETLLGWAHHAWLELASTGDPGAAANAVKDASPARVNELVRALAADRLVVLRSTSRPWTVVQTVVTQPSWGTQEVPAGIAGRGRLELPATILASLAVAAVLAARQAGRRSRSFARITRLLAAVARWPGRVAEPAQVAHALHCVRNVALVLPFRVACMEETAAAMLVLALTGRRAGWCHGIAADPVRLHAWIALDGQPIREPETTTRYTLLLRIPSPARARGGRQGDLRER